MIMKTLNEWFIMNGSGIKNTALLWGVMCSAFFFVSCGGGVVKKEKENNQTEMRVVNKVKNKVENCQEEAPKFAATEMVGVWEYYSEPTNKIEIIFKKDGTLIDYINFHTTGTYNVDPEGTVLTMQFTYADGHETQTSKPMRFKVQEYTGKRLILQTKGGTLLYYDRKEKSDNYDGKY